MLTLSLVFDTAIRIARNPERRAEKLKEKSVTQLMRMVKKMALLPPRKSMSRQQERKSEAMETQNIVERGEKRGGE